MQLARKKVTGLFGIGLFCLQFTFFSTIFAQTKQTVKPIVKKPTQSADVLNRQSLGEIRKKGFDYLQNQNWESASLTFEEALVIAPKDVSSLYGKALALFNLKLISEAQARIDAALNALSQTKENKPLLVDSLVLSAVISAVQNKSSLAIDKLERAIKIIPNHFDANFSLGRAYFGNGEIEKSILVAIVLLRGIAQGRADAFALGGIVIHQIGDFQHPPVRRLHQLEARLRIGALPFAQFIDDMLRLPDLVLRALA